MKKLSLIAGLACLATIGGVFGSWVFGNETENLEIQADEIAATVDTDVTEFHGITLDGEITDDVTITVTQNEERGTSYKFVGDGSISFNFKDNTIYGDGQEPTAYTATAAVEIDGWGTWAELTAETITATVNQNTVTLAGSAIAGLLAIDEDAVISSKQDVLNLAVALASAKVSLVFTVAATF